MTNSTTQQYEYAIEQARADRWTNETRPKPYQLDIINAYAADGWRLVAVGGSDYAYAGVFYLYFERPVKGDQP